MAKMYRVDVGNLSAEEIRHAREQLSFLAFMVTDVLGSDGMISAFDVVWDSSEDFATSPARPANCSYYQRTQ
jgi:hypothetical protein